jgi:hypothetical protein
VSHFQEQLKLVKFFKACIESSVYISPTDSGLIYDELAEIGRRAGYQPGEVSDALLQLGTRHRGNARFQPRTEDASTWLGFLRAEQPDYRNPDAFEFVIEEVLKSVRTNGARNVKLERSVVVERAANELPRIDVHAALTVMVVNGLATETNGILSFGQGAANLVTPSSQSAQHPFPHAPRDESRALAHSLTKDIIERRSDGRPKSVEPFEAFAEALEKLGYGAFRMWWTQMVAELRQADSQTSSVTIAVLSAALVEGALTFVVKHARTLGLGPMGSKTFDGTPSSWRIDDLISSAASGKDNAILDNPTLLRANTLIRSRQRIHAGRMLLDFPAGPPDLRPEEARDALSTAEKVVRCIVDWLQQHPPTPEDHA